MSEAGTRGGTVITDLEQLREVVGEPMARAVTKVRPVLDDVDRAFIDSSTLHLIATSGADGSLDVSPKGDPAGRCSSPTTGPCCCPTGPATAASTE
ncbi:hypothetical protein ACFPK1_15465 [Actinomycetospora rhizophila]|uniref:Uncharacterized protein n=1 Tax=Actinomycetospora rhizophila TaxID=1416876 RepID=A0ABV9ZDG7_9PSEU